MEILPSSHKYAALKRAIHANCVPKQLLRQKLDELSKKRGSEEMGGGGWQEYSDGWQVQWNDVESIIGGLCK